MAATNWQTVSTSLKRVMTDELCAVEAWKEQRSDVYPDIGRVTQYDEQNAEWRAGWPPSCDLLVEALRSSEILRPDLNLGASSWTDVDDHICEYVDSAKDTYEARAVKSKIRRFIREGESTASIGKRISEAIPDEKGIKVLRVGLSYIFQAWGKRVQNRTAILDTLHDTPHLLLQSSKHKDLYRDRELSDKLRELYITVIEVLPQLVDILNRAHKEKEKNILKRITKQDPEIENQVIQPAFERIRNAKARYYDHIDLLHRVFGKNAERMIINVKQELGQVRDTQSRLGNDSKQEFKAVNGKLDILAQETRQKYESMRTFLENTPAEIFLQLLHQLFADDGLKLMCNAENKMTRSVTPDPTASRLGSGHDSQQSSSFIRSQGVTAEYLLGMLNAPDSLADAEGIARQARSMMPQSLDRASWLMVTPQFKDWLSAGPSSLLLVDGHSTDQGIGYTSPVSIHCTTLVSMLFKASAGIVLQFYCGHSDLLDPSAGPRATLKSMISQLISFPKAFNLWFDKLDPNAPQDMQNNNIDALCYCFEHLFQQVPLSTSVYVIIDGLSSFEHGYVDFSGDLDRVFSMLRAVFDNTGFNRESGPRLKVLVTSAQQSTRLAVRPDVDQLKEHVSLNTGNAVPPGLQIPSLGSMTAFQ